MRPIPRALTLATALVLPPALGAYTPATAAASPGPADAGGPVGLTVGPDGALYAALFKVGGPNYVARFDSAGNVVRAWPVPGALIVATSQGAVWATDAFADTVTRIRTQCPPA